MGRAKSRLHAALANEKGVDYDKLAQKKKQKEALKRKRSEGKATKTGKTSKGSEDLPVSDDEDDDWEGVDDDEEDEDLSEDDGELGGLIDDIAEETEDDDGDGEEDGLSNGGINFLQPDNDVSSSDSEVEMEEKIRLPKPTSFPPTKPTKSGAKEKRQEKKLRSKDGKNGELDSLKNDDEEDDEEEEDEEEDEEDIELEDLEDLDPEDKEDLVPHTRVTINNHTALLAALNRIALPGSAGAGASTPFAARQSLVSSSSAAAAVPDVQDDLQRELAFYSQCLEAASRGRALLLREGVPFSRPTDYFAEMAKSDAQMDKVKARLVDEATAKKAAAEARKLRDLKKFGKQVQVAKEQERARQKRDTLDKIKTLKKRRQEGSSAALGAKEADDIFDVAVDNEINRHENRKRQRPGASASGGPSAKRQKKNDKYGFGGKKRNSKSGDAFSSGDLSGFSMRRMKSGAGVGARGARGGGGVGGGRGGRKTARPGKSKRKVAASRT